VTFLREPGIRVQGILVIFLRKPSVRVFLALFLGWGQEGGYRCSCFALRFVSITA